jgi:hexosaminidase
MTHGITLLVVALGVLLPAATPLAPDDHEKQQAPELQQWGPTGAAADVQIPPSLWPQPVSHTQHTGSSRLVAGAKFSCKVVGASNDILENACGRYEGYISAQSFPVSRRPGFGATPTGALLVAIVITAADVTSEYGLRTNESYSLSVGNTGAARLHAAHAVGALRGLETFFQLLQPLRPGEFTVSPVDVVDVPRWSHRGLLVDTGRHFYPVAFLKHIIEGMAMEKLSVLHWHITEILSFPLVVESVPELADVSAFSTAERYSHANVADVVAHARNFGVRVIP